MSGSELGQAIQAVSDQFEQLGIVHAVTGSFASGVHGEPVTSMDVDFVVAMTQDQAARLAADLGGRFYADAESLGEAARNRSMANVVDNKTGLKVDISVLSDTPYHAEVLRRRVRISHPTENVSFWVVSPEDIILMKLVWRIDTHSRKQWENALSVVRVQANRLDWGYLRHWAEQLNVLSDLEQLARDAGI